MGSKVRGVPEAAPVTDGSRESETSAGHYLARQRRLREISLDELAARTKIPRRSLERLEAGAFDGQADGFVRGFVRTVAEALGLDPNEAVMRLLREPPAAREAAAPAAPRVSWAIGGVLALAILAAALLLGGRALRQRFAAEPPELVYRPDAVRTLVAERARGEGAAEPLPAAAEAESAPAPPEAPPAGPGEAPTLR